MIEEFAPAKVNLALHVTGRRADGYHLLDSLVAFASVGDSLSFEAADGITLEIDGPFGEGLDTADNLVMRAAQSLSRLTGEEAGARIRLTKALPVASGIGGGSADAAATLRGLIRLWDAHTDEREIAELAESLGADVPVCLNRQSCRMSGIGEQISPLTGFPEFPAILVNPGCELSTPAVFQALGLDSPGKGFAALDDLPAGASQGEWLSWLASQRNDLESAALAVEPAIGEVLDALRSTSGSMLVRMSGSGATCFAIYRDSAARSVALKTLMTTHPAWWIRPCRLGTAPIDKR